MWRGGRGGDRGEGGWLSKDGVWRYFWGGVGFRREKGVRLDDWHGFG